jgi:hypothetical protein
LPTYNPKHQENQKHYEEDKEEYARNPSARRGYASEAKETGNNRDYEKNKRPSQHLHSPSISLSFSTIIPKRYGLFKLDHAALSDGNSPAPGTFHAAS